MEPSYGPRSVSSLICSSGRGDGGITGTALEQSAQPGATGGLGGARPSAGCRTGLKELFLRTTSVCGPPDVAAWLRAHDLPDGAQALEAALHGSPGTAVDRVYGPIELALGAAPVVAEGEDRFAFDDDLGRMAVIQPIADAANAVVDLVAWRPERPERTRTLRGAGELLGAAAWGWHDAADPPLAVARSPLSWLRAGGGGICLLRRDRDTVQRYLGPLTAVGAEDDALAAELDRLLREPGHLPRILARRRPSRNDLGRTARGAGREGRGRARTPRGRR